MESDNSYILLILLIAVAGIWILLRYKRLKENNNRISEENKNLAKNLEKLTRANSQLVADNALLEAEHLKFQLQPHTLGNVVSTLNAIAKNLHRGTESLAESLNYILYKGNSHLVSIEDELEFIRKYIQLNQLLYSDIISVRLDDSEVDYDIKHFRQQCLPHLISAYLIENAYKHGDKTHPEFLKVKITLISNKFEMVVINKINAKPTQHLTGGIGLKNMEKRLGLLVANRFKLETSCNEQEYRSTLTIHFDHEQA